MRLPSPSFTLHDALIGLAGSHQVANATLAVNLAHQYLLSQEHRIDSTAPLSPSPFPLSPGFVAGLGNARWPGRCQQVADSKAPGLVWFLDGAHTTESLTACTSWYCAPNTGFRKSDGGYVLHGLHSLQPLLYSGASSKPLARHASVSSSSTARAAARAPSSSGRS